MPVSHSVLSEGDVLILCFHLDDYLPILAHQISEMERTFDRFRALDTDSRRAWNTAEFQDFKNWLSQRQFSTVDGNSAREVLNNGSCYPPVTGHPGRSSTNTHIQRHVLSNINEALELE